jgi:hypothetical protein
MKMAKQIKWEFTEGHRGQCTVCGGYSEACDRIYCEGCCDGNWFRVCNDCLEHYDSIDAQLQKHAAGLEAELAHVRSLIGQLNTPSLDEWRSWAAAQDDAA